MPRLIIRISKNIKKIDINNDIVGLWWRNLLDTLKVKNQSHPCINSKNGIKINNKLNQEII